MTDPAQTADSGSSAPRPRADSLGDLVRQWASEQPDAACIIETGHGAHEIRRVSWAQVAGSVDALTAGFVALGLEPGDRLAIQSATSLDFVLSYLAGLQAGLVVVPVNPAYTAAELTHILTDSGARVLVTDSASVLDHLDGIRADLPALSEVVLAGHRTHDERPTVSGLAGAPVAESVRRDRRGDDIAVLLYTSGTSGRPKGAMLSVRALMSNLAQFAALSPGLVSPADRILLPLPLFHVFGLNAGLGMSLYFGAAVVLVERFDAGIALHEVAEHRISVIIGAPLEFALLAALPDFEHSIAGVRFALSGSAPLLPELVSRYHDAGVELFEGYGLTEAAPVITVNLVPAPGGGGEQVPWLAPKAGSIGRPLPGVQVRLCDADGEVEVGDLGTLQVRGQNLFSGYWPDGADGPDDEGWFNTGDLAVADDDGDLYLVGRRNDLVLVNGFNVYPAEVEAVFVKLDGVAEVAVLGEPDETGQDVVVAYVVPEPSVVLDPEDLLRQAAASLARFKLPRRVVEVQSLPHTATGKVMKWRLRAASRGEVSALRRSYPGDPGDQHGPGARR